MEICYQLIQISYSHRPIVMTTLVEMMTDANKVMNPHFGSDPANIWNRIPKSRFETRITSVDVRWMPRQRFLLSVHSLVFSLLSVGLRVDDKAIVLPVG